MSRLITAGAEPNHSQVDNVSIGGTVPIVSSPVRSGNFAYSLSYATAGNTVSFNWTGVSGRWFYNRVWFRSTGLSSVARPLSGVLQSSILMFTIFQHPDGTISTSATYGARPHSAPVPINEWHCFEVGVMSDGANLFYILKLDGVQFVSSSLGIAQIVNRFRFGTTGATDPNTIYIDDLALNDDQGSNQNSWPDIHGQIVLITPNNDQAVGVNWALGQGTAPAGLAYESVNNTPPLGVSNGVAGADSKQIRNAVASIAQPAADADLKCPAYSSVIPAGNGIKVLAPIFEVGHTSSSIINNLDVGLIDKPSQALTTVALPVGAVSNFTSLWNRVVSDVIYDPSVALSDQAVLRIGRRSAAALTQLCCFAGIMVEYELLPPSSGQQFLAVV